MNADDAKRPLPPGWRWAKLGDLFEVQQGVAMSPYRRQGLAPRPFLRTLNVLWHDVDLSALDQMDFSDDEVARLTLRPGDLLVCEGGDVGRTAIWRGELDVCLHQNHIHRLRRRSDDVEPEFYVYWMQAAFQIFRSYVGQWGETTIANLSGGRLKRFLVPVPPYPEQRRIAARLSGQMAVVERTRRAALAQVEAAKALPASFVRQVFESEEAKTWLRVRLADMCRLAAGGTPSRAVPTYWNGTIPWAAPKDMKVFDLCDTQQHITQAALSESAASLVAPGAVLVVVRGMILARDFPIAVTRVPLAFNQDIRALIPNEDKLHAGHLAYALMAEKPRLLGLVAPAAHGTLRLDAVLLREFPIPCPDVRTQRRLARDIASTLAVASRMQAEAQAELEAVDALPGALLEDVFGGFEPPS